MMHKLYQDLAWLPPLDKDLIEQSQRAFDQDEMSCPLILKMSKCKLSNVQLRDLSRYSNHPKARKSLSERLTPFRLAIVGTSTTELFFPTLKIAGFRHGINMEIIQFPFNQIMSEVTDPESALYTSKPDAILFVIDSYFILSLLRSAPKGETQCIFEFYEQIRENVSRNGNSICIFQSLPSIPESLFGSFDIVMDGTARKNIALVNSFLTKDLLQSGDLILDVAHISETVGLHEWYDPVYWHMAKMVFSPKFVPLYSDHICRLLCALKGKSKKCLVLDLDNTLWGGVIGDDGLEGIKIEQGDAIGEAFLSIQKMAKAYKERGIILAVCSKNDENIAKSAFRDHPEMVLKESDISVFQANWNDKASNIQAIAKTLNIGLDSIVFMDDNPAEREIVRQNLPEVAVPELPDDPSYYPRYMSAAGYFDVISFSEEDKSRADYYTQNARRAELESVVGDYNQYLHSLEMRAEIKPFENIDIKRVTQLINKSNQFNLTTIRYTELDVKNMCSDTNYFTLQARLEDRFGDNGLVSVVICRKTADAWDVDTWVMSCRVLKRRLEEAVLQKIIEAAKIEGCKTLKGRYIRTEKNGLVKNHYMDLGFSSSFMGDGYTDWVLDVSACKDREIPIRFE